MSKIVSFAEFEFGSERLRFARTSNEVRASEGSYLETHTTRLEVSNLSKRKSCFLEKHQRTSIQASEREEDIKDLAVTNFNVPRETRTRFDAICRESGKTRTAALVELMEGFIISQGKVLAERKSAFDDFDKSMGLRDQRTSDWNRPPDIFRTDGNKIW